MCSCVDLPSQVDKKFIVIIKAQIHGRVTITLYQGTLVSGAKLGSSMDFRYEMKYNYMLQLQLHILQFLSINRLNIKSVFWDFKG